MRFHICDPGLSGSIEHLRESYFISQGCGSSLDLDEDGDLAKGFWSSWPIAISERMSTTFACSYMI
eukprot:619340-Amorphochlora_amoeboformis.AAC.1